MPKSGILMFLAYGTHPSLGKNKVFTDFKTLVFLSKIYNNFMCFLKNTLFI